MPVRSSVAFWGIVVVVGLTAKHASAADPATDAEKNSYCRYVQDAGEAERALDTGVQAYSRIGQSDTNATTQIVVGASKSLSKHLQGIEASNVARIQCELYQQSADIDKVTKYKMNSITRQIESLRVKELKKVIGIVDDEIAKMEKRKKAGNATVADLLAIKEQRYKLFSEYSASKDAVAAIILPEVPDTDIAASLKKMDEKTLALQKELNQKSQLQTWDVTLTGGLEKPLSGASAGSSNDYKPFVSVLLNYNLNASDYARKLDQASASLIEYQHQQDDGLYHRVDVLQKSMAASSQNQREILPVLKAELSQMSSEYKKLHNLNSPEGLRAQSQIRVNLAMTEMELHLAQLKLKLFTENHARN